MQGPRQGWKGPGRIRVGRRATGRTYARTEASMVWGMKASTKGRTGKDGKDRAQNRKDRRKGQIKQ